MKTGFELLRNMKNCTPNKSLIIGLALFAFCALITKGQTFTCDSSLYQVVNGQDLKVLDPSTGVYQTIGSSSITYNGAGFNYEDGYLYGIGSGTVLVRIDNTGEATNLGAISGFSAISFSGDLDTLGNWYSFRLAGSNWIMNTIDVSAAPPVAVEQSVTVLSGAATARNTNDIAYNSVSNKFYGMHAGIMVEYDPFNRTVKGIADYSATVDGGGYGAVWSDVNGNTYFFNNGTGNIYRASFDGAGNILSFAFVATSAPNGSNDGMSCPLAAPPVFPEVCGNGIDDDGDGLIDCDDPDCTATETCGVSGVIQSSASACESSISTYHTFFTNNSTISNTITVTEVLPTGFVFLQDTIEFDAGGSNAGTYQPVDGDEGTIQWGPLTLEGGETVRISYDVSFNENVVAGTNTNNVTVALTTASTNFFPSTLSSNINVAAVCPEPNTYTCEPAFYQVYKKRGKNQPNMYGKLNPETGDYDPIAVASDYANGLGYDINTGLVYGASGKKFIQLDEDGIVIDMGITFSKKVYRGDINSSSKWYGVAGSDMIIIDVNGAPFVEATYSGQGLPGWDIAYNTDGHFYSVHGTTLYQYNTTTNTKSTLGTITGTALPTSGGYGAQWTGSDGKLYISHNSSGSIIQVDVVTLEARVVSSSIDGLSKNDGFSCPTEIPAVFEFDRSDNSRLPQSRILAYYQDLSNDGVPDYSTVWIGNTVTFDTTDPQNANADGDLDDGFTLATEIDNGELATVIELNSNQNVWSYHLIGIDWDDDGSFDEIISDSTYLTGAQTLVGSITVPNGFTEGDINVRVLISEERLTNASISGDILGMGEVEDYRYLITSPCVGDGCEIDGGGDGGLESNGSLAAAISKRTYDRARDNYKGNLRVHQTTLQSFRRARTTSSNLDGYFPSTGVNGTEEVTVSSPTDLVGMTNATDVFALDYYQTNRRVAASLLLTTQGEVYNHSKNVCDRLNGKSIEEAKLMNLDGVRVIYTKIRNESGAVEYTAWFAAKDSGSEYEVFSLWSVDDYPGGDYLNFQAWGSSPSQVFHILKHSLDQLKGQKSVTVDPSIQQLPEVMVKTGYYENGKLNLSILNRGGASAVQIRTSIRKTEISSYEEQDFYTDLTGEASQDIVLTTGHLFDAGISLQVEEASSIDALYLADGAWGTDFNTSFSQVPYFAINEVNTETQPGAYQVERGFTLNGTSSDVINVFRNIKAGLKTLSLAPYRTLGFDISSTHPIEVVLVEKGLAAWEDRLHLTIPARNTEERVVLNLDDFNGVQQTADMEIQTIVFSYLNHSGQSESISLSIDNVSFGDEPSLVSGIASEMDVDFSIYPNPASEGVDINLEVTKKQGYEIRLLDTSGRVKQAQKGTLQTGSNSVRFDLNETSFGIYIIQVILDDKEASQKVIIR